MRTVAIAMTLFALMMVIPAQAQTVRQMNAAIPFDFNIGDARYEAGVYEIKPSCSSQVIWCVKPQSGGPERFFFAAQNGGMNKQPEKPILIFERVGGVNFLKEIQVRGNSLNWTVSKGKMQREITATTSNSASTVEVALAPQP